LWHSRQNSRHNGKDSASLPVVSRVLLGGITYCPLGQEVVELGFLVLIGLAKPAILFNLLWAACCDRPAKRREMYGFSLSNWLIAITSAIKQHAAHLA